MTRQYDALPIPIEPAPYIGPLPVVLIPVTIALTLLLTMLLSYSI